MNLDRADLRPTDLERAAGFVFGTDVRAAEITRRRAPSALRAFGDAMVPALERTPCVVAFSGGRDSSAVLAVATSVARRVGLDPPIPVTMRFPGRREADESRWQELVVRHLGLKEWHRIELADELDYLGPLAQRALRRYGALWPANHHAHYPALQAARGGSLVDGVDGDMVLFWGRAPATAFLRGRGRPSPTAIKRLAHLIAPRTLSRAVHIYRPLMVLDWLRAPAQGALTRLTATETAREPKTWPARLRWFARLRYVSALRWTTTLAARETDTLVVRPFLDGLFLSTLGYERGRFGFGGRTSELRALFGSLLPDEVLERTDKAMFWHYWGPHSNEFTRAWDGRGVDWSLVDEQRLRAEWAKERPDHRSALLLQSAWLAAGGDRMEQPGDRVVEGVPQARP